MKNAIVGVYRLRTIRGYVWIDTAAVCVGREPGVTISSILCDGNTGHHVVGVLAFTRYFTNSTDHWSTIFFRYPMSEPKNQKLEHKKTVSRSQLVVTLEFQCLLCWFYKQTNKC